MISKRFRRLVERELAEADARARETLGGVGERVRVELGVPSLTRAGFLADLAKASRRVP